MAQPPPYSPPMGQPGYPPIKAGEGAGYPPGYPPPQQSQSPPQAGSQPHTAPQYPYPNQPGYPAQSGYHAMQQPTASHHQTTIIQQPSTAVVIGSAMFGETPVSMTCPNCHATIVTAVRYEPGTLTWLACLGLCLVGCDLGCCFIPFCVDGMQDAVHTCPACQRQLGVYRRM